MKLRESRISNLSLFFITFITILLMVFEFNSKSMVQTKHFEEKIKAAELTLQSFKVIKNAADKLNIPIDRINDPNGTGLIGLQYSPTTTERGDLNAKLTSTNPNFAALIVELLKSAGVKKNDEAAVSFTGSFPALNIAVLSAIKILQLNPIIITSVGSSMWGANYPQLSYLDMERELRSAGLIDHQSIAASIGGEDDIGRGLSPEGREIIQSVIAGNNIQILDANDLGEAIQKRIEIYTKNGLPKVLINIGGGSAALGGMTITTGFIKPRQIKLGKGLIAQFSQMGVPVINLEDISNLAEKYRLPLAPIPLPRVGEGSLYYEMKYSVNQAILYTIILVVLLFFILRFDIDYYLRKGLRKKK